MNLKSSLFISLRYYYVRFLEKQKIIINKNYPFGFISFPVVPLFPAFISPTLIERLEI